MRMRIKTRIQKHGNRLKAEIPESIRDNFKPGEIVYVLKNKVNKKWKEQKKKAITIKNF